MFRLFPKTAFASFVILSACTVADPTRMVEIISNESSTSLWLEYGRNQSPIALSLIETELVSRGETKFGSYYIGQKTGAAFGQSLYSRAVTSTIPDLKNCSDFANSAAAQRFFIQAGGPLNDPNNLDADGDGLACEWGTKIRSIARQATAPPPTVRTRPRYTSRCYVGPRGGTYTMTSNGARNYNGC